MICCLPRADSITTYLKLSIISAPFHELEGRPCTNRVRRRTLMVLGLLVAGSGIPGQPVRPGGEYDFRGIPHGLRSDGTSSRARRRTILITLAPGLSTSP